MPTSVGNVVALRYVLLYPIASSMVDIAIVSAVIVRMTSRWVRDYSLYRKRALAWIQQFNGAG